MKASGKITARVGGWPILPRGTSIRHLFSGASMNIPATVNFHRTNLIEIDQT